MTDNTQSIEQIKQNIKNLQRIITSGNKSSSQVVTIRKHLNESKERLLQLQEQQFSVLTVNEFILWTENQFVDWHKPNHERVRKFVVQTLSDLNQFYDVSQNISFCELKNKYDIDRYLELFFQ